MIAPIAHGENGAAWLQRAAREGQPALVPAAVDGQRALASGVLTYHLLGLNPNPDRMLSAIVAIDACHRVRRWARDAGAEVCER